MINLEITTSNQPDNIGFYKIFTNKVYIGNSNQNDIILLDETIKTSLMKLEIINDKVYITSPSYISDGKKVSGTKIHTTGSTFIFGTSQFKILDFKKSIENSDLNLIYQEKIIEIPYLEGIISDLKDEILKLERELNV